MEIHLKSDLESRLKEHAQQRGCTADELLSGLVEGYLQEVAELKATIESRWQAYKSGEVKPIDGEEAFKLLRQRALERVKQHSRK